MIKNYNFNISEEEKKQILSLHESRTKRHYLINEQQKTAFNDEIEKKYVKQIQSELGFKDQSLDGKLGPKTYAAIMAKLTGTTDDKKAADKLAADKLAADKLAADKLAADKLAADKLTDPSDTTY